MKFTCARIFSDNMVLQRNQEIPVFGCGRPGAEITVMFNGAKEKSVVGQDGKWLVKLPAMDKRGAMTLTVESEDETITFENVVLGEVWLAGGQSNMEFEMYKAKGGFADIANSADADLRYYQVEQTESNEARYILKRPCPAGWVAAEPDYTAHFSAVAYYFAMKLRKELDVPVGIVGCSWGGTSASCWLSEEMLSSDEPLKVYLEEYAQQTEGRTQEEYLKAKDEYDALVAVYEEKLNYTLATYKDEDEWRAEYKKLEYPWPPPMGDRCFMRPCGLYDTMVKYAAPYGIRGALWYQGEGDAGHAELYAKLLSLVMEQWRKDFMNPDMFVGVVQLTAFGSEAEDDASWGVVRTQQEKMAVEDGNAAFAVIYDVGEKDDIHPIEKRTVGNRLADQILVKLYGKEIDAAYAEVIKAEAADGKIILKVTEPLVCKEDALGFQILKDGKWSFVKAGAGGEEITLFAESAEAVRYAYTTWTEANVYQKNGIPLKPFEVKIGS